MDPNKLTVIDLHHYLQSKLGDMWYTFEFPIIEEAFDTELTPITINKIDALKSIFLTDLYATNWQVFDATIKALTDNIEINTVNPPTLLQLTYGLYLLHKLRPIPFTDDVKSYIASILAYHNITKAPEFIPVQQELDELLKNKYIPDNSIETEHMEELYKILNNLETGDTRETV
ncbi:MAG: hypothetical protein ACP5JE_03260 [Thermoplasmata archaeon]